MGLWALGAWSMVHLSLRSRPSSSPPPSSPTMLRLATNESDGAHFVAGQSMLWLRVLYGPCAHAAQREAHGPHLLHSRIHQPRPLRTRCSCLVWFNPSQNIHEAQRVIEAQCTMSVRHWVGPLQCVGYHLTRFEV